MYSPITGKEGAGEGERGGGRKEGGGGEREREEGGRGRREGEGGEREREERGGRRREGGAMKDNPQYLNEYINDYINTSCCCFWLVTGFASWFYPCARSTNQN